jgi:formate hydrogenlyase subunit 6/NADH:ubiquinone oxidoreductase subunit I
MKVGTMLSDVLRSLLRPPATERYPYERRDVPERLRGHIHWLRERCTGCTMCARDCPADALELIIVDKATKRFVLSYDASRCVYCAQCAESCRFEAILLPNARWELAGENPEDYAVLYGTDDDVAAVVEGRTRAHAPAPSNT